MSGAAGSSEILKLYETLPKEPMSAT